MPISNLHSPVTTSFVPFKDTSSSLTSPQRGVTSLPSPPPTIKYSRSSYIEPPRSSALPLVFSEVVDDDEYDHHDESRLDPHRINRRKLSTPMKSLKHGLSVEDKSIEGVVILDVYDLYKRNPALLLQVKRHFKRFHPYLAPERNHNRPDDMDNYGSLSPPPMTNTSTRGTSSSPDPSSPKRNSNNSSNAFNRIATSNSSNIISRPVGRPPKKRGRPTTNTTNAPSNAAHASTTPSKYHEGPKQLKAVPEGFNPFRPTPDAFDGVPPITWSKSLPMEILPDTEGYDMLAPQEVASCSTLRLTPMAYLKIKGTLLIHNGRPLKKREAQSVCRVDVNKVGKLYDWFVNLGWLIPPQSSTGTGN